LETNDDDNDDSLFPAQQSSIRNILYRCYLSLLLALFSKNQQLAYDAYETFNNVVLAHPMLEFRKDLFLLSQEIVQTLITFIQNATTTSAASSSSMQLVDFGLCRQRSASSSSDYHPQMIDVLQRQKSHLKAQYGVVQQCRSMHEHASYCGLAFIKAIGSGSGVHRSRTKSQMSKEKYAKQETVALLYSCGKGELLMKFFFHARRSLPLLNTFQVSSISEVNMTDNILHLHYQRQKWTLEFNTLMACQYWHNCLTRKITIVGDMLCDREHLLRKQINLPNKEKIETLQKRTQFMTEIFTKMHLILN